MNDVSNTIYTIAWLTIYLVALGIFLFVLTYLVATFFKRNNEKANQYKLTFLQIKLPPDNEFEVKVAEHLFASLMGIRKGFFKALFTGQYRISFEIVSKKEGIGFYAVVPKEIAPVVEKQINADYPTAEIDIINPHEIWDRGKHTQIAELKLKGHSFYPIRQYEEMKGDSISSITSAMSKLDDDEVLAVQYILQPAGDSWREAGQTFISRVKNRANNSEKKVNIDTSFLENVEKKIAQPGFYTTIRIVSIAKDKILAQSQIQNMTGAFEQFADVNYNKFKKRFVLFPNKFIKDFIYRRMNVIDIFIPILGIQIYSNRSVLNIIELATIFHFPNKDIGTPNILWLGARSSSAPTNIPNEGLYLGESMFRGVEKKIYMQEKDRARHLYIVGQTGTGKSQFLMQLALQDIKNGEGLAIIDPHGTDIDELIQKIPIERKDDVIVFDPSDSERPLGLNMLEAHSEEEKHIIINAFIDLLYKLYDPNHQGIMGPILERTIRNVMLTAMVDPESTMVDVMRILIDDEYAKKYIDKLEDPLVKRYWTDEVAKTPVNKRGENMGYFTAKFDRFITDKTMRSILGQPKSSFDLNEVMAQKKILLVKLAKGRIGEENSNFLGLLLVPRILSAALGRQKLIEQGQDFPNFYLYVDEFQNFATPAFATILSEARKYKLNLTVAHQFIAQLPEDIKEAIFGNVGTLCTFRVGAEDAEFLEKQYEPNFTKKDLINLPNGKFYIKLLINGEPTVPFSMGNDWARITAQKKDPAVAAQIKETSRMKYGKPIEEIIARVDERMGIQEPELPPLPDFDKTRIPF